MRKFAADPSDQSDRRGRLHRGRDAISVADAEAPPVVLATEHRRDPEVQRHELVAADALDPRVLDSHDIAEILAS
jgi:hypothetical protein